MTIFPKSKKRLALLCLLLAVAIFAGFQTHTFPALDTNNVFTGSNTFNGSIVVSGAATLNGPFVTGANQLNLPAGTPIWAVDDWSRLAIWGSGIIPGKWSNLAASFPLGNDMPILATGPADLPLRHIDLVTQCQASVTSGSEQTCTLQLPAPIAGTFSGTGISSGGSLAAATNYFIKATWKACSSIAYLANGLMNPACPLGGETTASPELTVTTPASCSPANTCSISVSFVGHYPTADSDVYPGTGAYNLYSSSTAGNELLMIANHDPHTTYTMTAVGGGASPPVSNTALFPVTSLLSTATHNGIVIDRGRGSPPDALRETLLSATCGSLTSGQWCISGTNTIHVFTAQNHTGPFEVGQYGSTILHGDNLFIECDKPLGAGGVNHNPPLILLDGSNSNVMKWPCDTGTGNPYPDFTVQAAPPITGLNGANKDLIFRSNAATSTTRFQTFNSGNPTGVDSLTIADSGAVTFPNGNVFVTLGTLFGNLSSNTANAATSGVLRCAAADSCINIRNNANTATLPLTTNASDILTYAGVPFTVFVTGDFTLAANTSLQAITGLTWTLPANAALKVPFSCHLLYSQATAAVADQFGIQDVTVAPTSLMAKAQAYISASTFTAGNLPTLTTTTATAVVTFTPSAITTIWNADIDGLIEQPSNASTSAINIMAQTSNSADLVTVKRGSFCRVF